MNKGRILVGMSGGIDSTWTVKKLLLDNWQVEGAVLVMHDNSPIEEARRAADSLGVMLHEVDCREAFSKKVESVLVSEYAKSRTPNPCVLCNAEIKFKYLAECARGLGIDKISTGHYVKVEKGDNGRVVLRMAEDRKKDQSYFLWRVSQEDLAMFHSTLEDDLKNEVKERLVEDKVVHDSRESQEICFIPDNERVEYLKKRMTPDELAAVFVKGDFVNTDGTRVGEHAGLINYTPGQRKGLGIALGRPAYVLRLDRENNRVVVGFEEDNRCERFDVGDLHFVSADKFEGECSCLVRVRHRGALLEAKVYVAGTRAHVELCSPDKTVSAGQSAVFYDEDGRVLFGGFID